MNHTRLREVFENLAEFVWQRLARSYELKINFGEETLTDILLLELAESQEIGDTHIHLLKTSKPVEARRGCDWEWWIGTAQHGWLRFAIQAKKAGRGHRYESLKHKVNGRLQIEILQEYAETQNALPLYCFYNYSDGLAIENIWHCPLALHPSQLGCTLVPLAPVFTAIDTHSGKNFRFIHSFNEAVPWRCLLSCGLDHVLGAGTRLERQAASHGAALIDPEVDNYCENLPPNLQKAMDDGEAVLYEDVDGIQPPLLPRRVMIMDVSAQVEDDEPQDVEYFHRYG